MTNIIQLADFKDLRKPIDPKCQLTYDPHTEDYDCGYKTNLVCDECKYGDGRKDPEANCNRELK